MDDDDKKLIKALESARPRWQNDNLGVRGNPQELGKQQMRTIWPPAQILTTRSDALPAPATLPIPTLAQIPPVSGGDSSSFPFQLSTDSTNKDAGSADISIVDGRVNDDLPDGMGDDDFTVTILNDSVFYLIVVFDATTLDQTSVTIGVAPLGGEPDSSLDSSTGTLIIPFGEAVITYDADSNVQVDLRNYLSTNVNYELIYGASNGAPALLPVATWGTGWLALPP